MMWNGVFSPYLQKHRDYEHGNYYDHVMDNGGGKTVDSRPVDVKYNPISALQFSPSQTFYFVSISLSDEEEDSGVYDFLISAEPDESEPNESRIKREFNRTLSNPVKGGRDWFEHLDFDSERTKNHPKVAARLEEEEIPAGPPRWRLDRDNEDEVA